MNSLGNEWYIDNKPSKKKLDIKSIFINPFDSFLFHTSASFRRNWFDSQFSILDNEYKATLKKKKNFNTALRFRNNLLSKKPLDFKNQVKASDAQFAKYNFYLGQMRKKFIEELNKYCESIFKNIFDESHLFKN